MSIVTNIQLLASIMGSTIGAAPPPAPTPAPTASPTPAPTPGPTPAPTPGPTPAPTPGPTPAPTPAPTPSPTGGTFTPDGGPDVLFPVQLADNAENGQLASVTINCTEPATWSHEIFFSIGTGSGNDGTVSVANNAIATSITFSLRSFTNPGKARGWRVKGVSGPNEKYWEVELTATGSTCPLCCFTPDTMIRMADMSLKPISEVKAGDMILVYNEETQTNVSTPVSEIITRENMPMYEITFADGNILKASADHPLYVIDKGYASVAPSAVEYKDLGIPSVLAVGDRVVNEFGVASAITKIEEIEYPGVVYTFGNSRFYANGVLVY